jgi:hypothetical protein
MTASGRAETGIVAKQTTVNITAKYFMMAPQFEFNI